MFVGSSVGSLFACEAAGTAGDRVGGVVVLDGPGHCHWAPNLADFLNTHLRNLATDRAEVVAPIIHVHGALDKAVPIHVPQEVATLIEGGTVVTIDGAGHLAQQERPAEVGTAIRAFVAGLPS